MKKLLFVVIMLVVAWLWVASELSRTTEELIEGLDRIGREMSQ